MGFASLVKRFPDSIRDLISSENFLGLIAKF